MTSALITKTYNDAPFVFREDGWFNMTKAAQHFGKDLQSFIRMDDTRDYVAALQANSVSGTEYLIANRGRYGGTWAHPKLAVFFARWLDVKFAVWCDAACLLLVGQVTRWPHEGPPGQCPYSVTLTSSCMASLGTTAHERHQSM